MNINKYIPNFITSLNIVCGVLSCFLTFEGYLVFAASLIILSSILDFLDGFMARVLNSFSAFGRELDSLADIISFGLAPSCILFYLLKAEIVNDINLSIFEEDYTAFNLAILFIPVLIPVFSALRLARYNISTQQQKEFVGLPVPANALLIVSLVFVKYSNSNFFLQELIFNKYLFVLLIIILSYLLVSNIKMFSLKMNNFKFRENKIQFTFLFITLILIPIYKEISLFFCMIFYLFLSICVNVYKRFVRKN